MRLLRPILVCVASLGTASGALWWLLGSAFTGPNTGGSSYGDVPAELVVLFVLVAVTLGLLAGRIVDAFLRGN